MPEAVLIAGANGAGKTTFARHFVPATFPDAIFLNADEIQREGPLSPLQAGRELIRRMEALVARTADFAIETTLSSMGYARRIPGWQSAGYRVTLFFLEVPNADLAVARVAKRVAGGGHHIPETDIRRRHRRGLDLFREVYRHRVDQWYWYKWNDKAYEIHAKGKAGPP